MYASQDAPAAAPAWEPVALEAVDWSRIDREPFTREFIAPPSKEIPGAEERREALGVKIEDLGSLRAAPAPAETFEEMPGIPAYCLENLREHGIVSPMPVQAQALPLVLSGCDVIGLAQTGSGKTLAFLLPAVAHIEAQEALDHRAASATPIVLVLAPTRELAVQISDEAAKVLKGSKKRSEKGNHRWGINAAVLYGGGSKREQLKSLEWGAHIIVATPGRLMDLVSAKNVSLERVTYFVLDEADRMLDFGFSGDVAALSGQVRPERQVLFFSATWSPAVQELARGLCHKGKRPVRISVGQHRAGGEAGEHGDGLARQAREGIIQEVVVVDYPGDYARQGVEKRRLLEEHLASVLEASEENKVLVFVSQKTFADELANKLWEAGFKAAAMHGGKAQEARLRTLDCFRKGEYRLLVATDVIGRGIDIPSVSHVVVFDMGTIDDYVHRIGRTARGVDGKGHALVFFEYWHKDSSIASQLVEVLQAAKQPVPEGLRRIAAEVACGQRQSSEQKFGKKQWGDGDGAQGTGNQGGWKDKQGWRDAAPEKQDGWKDKRQGWYDRAAPIGAAPGDAADAKDWRKPADAADGGTSGADAGGGARWKREPKAASRWEDAPDSWEDAS